VIELNSIDVIKEILFLLLVLGSLVILEIHIYQTFHNFTMSSLDTLIIVMIGLPCIHNSIINNLVGIQLFISLLAPILAFIASASAIIIASTHT